MRRFDIGALASCFYHRAGIVIVIFVLRDGLDLCGGNDPDGNPFSLSNR